MALVIASVYYNMQPTTDSFFQRGALIFFAVLLNAFGSALEVMFPSLPEWESHRLMSSFTDFDFICATSHC